ncbi:MAG: hypothetical protein HOK99_08980 [Betaproteobacteria bacterium]|jgi:hypothetical protein|nr:hypothetical protein [Betaproteobacteria bacterium]
MPNFQLRRMLCIAMLMATVVSNTVDARDYNVLVMGDDQNKKALARNTRPFEQVMNAISRNLAEDGFRVIDEVMATGEKFVQGRIRRPKQELFDIAKLIVDPPIDFIVTFTVLAEFETSKTVKFMTLRSSSQIFAVGTNQLITNLQTTPLKDIPTENLCNLRKRCRMKYIGEHAEKLGNQLGATLVTHLRAYVGKTSQTVLNEREELGSNQEVSAGIIKAHRLTFEGFSANDFFKFEKSLKNFPGYVNHRIIKLYRFTQQVYYETQALEHEVIRNLHQAVNKGKSLGSIDCSNLLCRIKKYPD